MPMKRAVSVVLVMLLALGGPFNGLAAFAQGQNELPQVDVNFGTEPYIEFTTPSVTSPGAFDLTAADVNRLRFALSGGLLGDVIQGDTNGKIEEALGKYGVSLYEVGAEDVMLDSFWSVFGDDLYPENMELEMGFMESLKPDTTYRIRFMTPVLRELVSRLAAHTYYDSGENLRLELRSDAEPNGPIYENMWTYDNGNTSESPVTFREFNGADKMTFRGPEMEVQLGDITNYGTPAKMVLLVEGEVEPVSQAAFTMKLTDTTTTSVVNTVVSDKISSIKLEAEVTDWPMQDGSGQSKVVMTGTDEAASWIVNEFREAIHDQHNRRAYMLAYNASDELIGFKLLKTAEDILYVDPQFTFDGAQPPFTGNPNIDDDRAKLDFIYTGMSDERIMIEGVTTVGVDTYPFWLTMDTDSMTGNFSTWSLYFESVLQDDYQPKAETPDPNKFYNNIPVNPFSSNSVEVMATIDGTGTEYDGVEFTKTFEWMPDGESVQSHIHSIHFETSDIGTGNTDLIVEMDGYDGDLSRLTIDGYVDPQNPMKMMRWTATSSELVEKFDEFNEPFTVTKVTFTEDEQLPDGYAGWDALMEDGQISLRLMFNDEALNITNLELASGHMIHFDTQPPMLNYVDFAGSLPYETTEYPALIVGFNEDVDVQDIITRADDLFTFSNEFEDVSGISVVAVEAYQNPEDPEGNASNEVLLYIDSLPPRNTQLVINGAFDSDPKGIGAEFDGESLSLFGEMPGQYTGYFTVTNNDGSTIAEDTATITVGTPTGSEDIVIPEMDSETVSPSSLEISTGVPASKFFKGVMDKNGNAIAMSEDRHINLETRVESQVFDTDGNLIVDAELKFIPLDKIPTPQVGQTIPWESIQHLHVDDEGELNGHIYPGEYLLFQIERFDDFGRRTEQAVDVVVTIPAMSQKETYMEPIILPQGNVTGNVVRQGALATLNFEETIVFIESQYVDELQTAMTDHDQWELFEILKFFYIKQVNTDTEGNFSTYLRPGTYNLLGKFIGDSVVEAKAVDGTPIEEGSLYSFTVDSVVTNINDVLFPAPTLIGTVQADGSPLGNVFVEFTGDTGADYRVLTDENGMFQLIINTPGTYSMSGVWTDWGYAGDGQLYVLDSGFQSTEITQSLIDAVEGGGSPLDLGTVALPATNFTANFAIDGDPVGKGEFSSIELQEVVAEGEFAPQFHIPSQTSNILMYLQDGDYQIVNFNSGPLWVEIADEDQSNYQFNVPSDAAFTIDLSEHYNVKINVKDESGQPLEGYRIEIQESLNNQWRSAQTNSKGDAYFSIDTENLGDSESLTITIQGYSIKDKWYNFHENQPTFTFTEGVNGPSNKATYSLTIQKPNFRGMVYEMDEGQIATATEQALDDALITDGNLSLRREAAEGEPDFWYGIWINEDGEFEFILDEPGEYLIESAGSWDTWFEIKKRIDVINTGTTENPQYVVVEPGTTTPIDMPMTIGLPAKNFSGYLFKAGDRDGSGNYLDNGSGVPYLQGVPEEEYHVSMLVRETGIDETVFQFEPWKYEIWVDVGQDGSFGAVLDPAKSYEVYAVSTSRRWIEFAEPIAVTVDASTTNFILPPQPSFYGQVVQFDGSEYTDIRHGRVELQSLDGTFWTGADIDESGLFGAALEAGKQYLIREYWLERETSPDTFIHEYVRLDREVTIGTETEDMVLRPNFKLTLSGDSVQKPTEDWQNFFNANIQPAYTQDDVGTLITQEEYDRYLMNPWEFSTWMEGKYNDQGTPENTSDDTVDFYSYLMNGSYKLIDINGHDMFLEVGEHFTLSESASSENIAYANGAYTLTLDYQQNVTGTITKNSVPVDGAWVNFQRTDGDWEDYTIRRWFGTRTNENGEFGLKLDDGQYKLEGYHTEGHWEGTRWINGQWTPVGYNFSVVNGDLYNADGTTPLSSITVEPNVTGEVYKIFKATDNPSDFIGTPVVGEYAQIQKAWLTIWPIDDPDDFEIAWDSWEDSIWTETNDQGQFTLMLDDGYYVVMEASMNNFWFQPETVFQISNGELVANEDVQDGTLIVQPEQPNFTGTAYQDAGLTKVLNWGWIMVRPADAEEHDWEKTVWINTDRYGNFEIKLPDGDWKVVEMGNHGFWKRMSIPFTVSSGTVTSSVTGFVEDGLVTIYPPEPNVVGLVKDKFGNQLFNNAWLTIKPADAGEHEWDKAIWTEYNNSTGSYKFELNLEPGDYKVVEVGSWNFFYRADTRFTVNSDLSITSTSLTDGKLVVQPPTPNFSGYVYGDTDQDGENDDLIKNGWIGIARFEDGVQVTMEGETIEDTDYKDEYSNMYWQHTRWTETTNQGTFEMNLPVGTYRVIAVSGRGDWYQPNLAFKIKSGAITELDITRPGPNVTVTVINVPTEMANASIAWLDVFEEVDGDKFFVPIEFDEKSGNDFVFKGYLQDGTYDVGFFGTEFGGFEIEDTEITVSGSANVTVNLGDEEGKVRISGQILRNSANLGQKAWIKIEGTVDGQTVTKKTQTDVDGNFAFKLPENTTWIVTEVSLKEGYLLMPDSSDYTFDATEGAEWQFDIGSLLD